MQRQQHIFLQKEDIRDDLTSRSEAVVLVCTKKVPSELWSYEKEWKKRNTKIRAQTLKNVKRRDNERQQTKLLIMNDIIVVGTWWADEAKFECTSDDCSEFINCMYVGIWSWKKVAALFVSFLAWINKYLKKIIFHITTEV